MEKLTVYKIVDLPITDKMHVVKEINAMRRAHDAIARNKEKKRQEWLNYKQHELRKQQLARAKNAGSNFLR